MEKKQKFDIGDDIFNPRRPANHPERDAVEAFEDTEGHVIRTHRTYPKGAPDDELEVRRHGLGEDDDRRNRI